jgi:hypothetical protein
MRGGVVGLGLVVMGSAAIVYYVHFEQKRELRRMQQSVYLDAEREQFRRQVLAQREPTQLGGSPVHGVAARKSGGDGYSAVRKPE